MVGAAAVVVFASLGFRALEYEATAKARNAVLKRVTRKLKGDQWYVKWVLRDDQGKTVSLDSFSCLSVFLLLFDWMEVFFVV
jgi:hypothetical protein